MLAYPRTKNTVNPCTLRPENKTTDTPPLPIAICCASFKQIVANVIVFTAQPVTHLDYVSRLKSPGGLCNPSRACRQGSLSDPRAPRMHWG
ncbi:hypothetical protein SKAU_G00114300 [Synaphobranchus kaupii]|uniref:Uncharacterized protein n=1 Tax=Synaphobranchus kaupii TaxID=118154 RepID=A0A9Q1J7M5_SYNKA|nr:hypothetical protein SKAU_G00114300 [Synaphobranchus kaupii]